MDDRLVPRHATNLHSNAQPKAVFFCAMTVMDKICGWGEEEKWVGSLFAACMWMYTKHVLCDGQETTQNFLKRKMMSIMESVNWVCEEVLEEHQWVSHLNISSKQEEVLRELDYCSLCGTTGISLVHCSLKIIHGSGAGSLKPLICEDATELRL